MLNLIYVYITVAINNWYNLFYDALQKYDQTGFFHLIGNFAWLALFNVILQLISYYLRKYLEIDWRRWETSRAISLWLKNKNYYYIASNIDNPDQRISEDISAFITLTLDLSIGLLTTAVSLWSFTIILWNLSKNFVIFNYHISGLMVWIALVYAIVGTIITFLVGKHLTKQNFLQQKYEAEFRYNLVRTREYAQDIAIYGEKHVNVILDRNFSQIVTNFMHIVKTTLKINGFNFGYGQASVLFPLLINLPSYFAKKITLGGLMQINSAFSRVQDALSYFADSYIALSNWRATTNRLYDFYTGIENITQTAIVYKNSDNLKVSLSLYSPDGRELFNNLNFSLKTGERLLIYGDSGIGKTTVLRAIARLWKHGSGFVESPSDIMFIGQKPYIAPNISLLESLDSSDIILAEQLLTDCNLSYLIPNLNKVNDWCKILSIGEQQCLSFIKILLNKDKYKLLLLDEATSALPELIEEKLYRLIIENLKITIISVAHRKTLEMFHTRTLLL